jgi:hypothetical protein
MKWFLRSQLEIIAPESKISPKAKASTSNVKALFYE